MSVTLKSEVKSLVAHFSFVVQLDGKSWFYQVAAEGLRSYFAVRTVLGQNWLVVLAMGWSWSVWIAQTLAMAIAQHAESSVPPALLHTTAQLQYIDNFIVAGESATDTSAMTSALKTAADECGAVFKPTSDTPTTSEVILGMQCDFKRKNVCVKEEWIKNSLYQVVDETTGEEDWFRKSELGRPMRMVATCNNRLTQAGRNYILQRTSASDEEGRFLFH